jgi:hypothetical protein
VPSTLRYHLTSSRTFTTTRSSLAKPSGHAYSNSKVCSAELPRFLKFFALIPWTWMTGFLKRSATSKVPRAMCFTERLGLRSYVGGLPFAPLIAISGPHFEIPWLRCQMKSLQNPLSCQTLKRSRSVVVLARAGHLCNLLTSLTHCLCYPHHSNESIQNHFLSQPQAKLRPMAVASCLIPKPTLSYHLGHGLPFNPNMLQ